LSDEALEGDAINTRYRDVDPEPHQQQQTQGDQHTIAQILGLDQLREDFTGTGVTTPADDHDRRVGARKNRLAIL